MKAKPSTNMPGLSLIRTNKSYYSSLNFLAGIDLSSDKRSSEILVPRDAKRSLMY